MKKIITSLALCAIFISSNISTVFAGYEVYITNPTTNKDLYEAGEAVTFNAIIHNIGDNDINNAQYRLVFGPYNGIELTSESFITEPLDKIFLKKQSKSPLSFSYTVPKDIIQNNLGYTLLIEIPNSAVLAFENGPLNFKGVPNNTTLITPQMEYIEYNQKQHNTSVSPRVKEGSSATINAIFDTVDQNGIEVTPIISLTDNQNNKTSQTLQKILIKPNEPVSVQIPNTLKNNTYTGTLELKHDTLKFKTVMFNYVQGEYATQIENIESTTYAPKKGDILTLSVSYTGGVESIFDTTFFDETSTTTDEVAIVPATLKVKITNQKGQLVSESVHDINLSDGQYIFEVQAENKAKQLTIEASIEKDGKILTEYKNQTPPQGSNFLAQILIFVGLIIILIILKIALDKKKILIATVCLTLCFSFIASQIGSAAVVPFWQKTSQSSTVNQAKKYYSKIIGAYGIPVGPEFNVSSVSNPKPPQVKKYAPGESFYLQYSAKFGFDVRTGGGAFFESGAEGSSWATTAPVNYVDFSSAGLINKKFIYGFTKTSSEFGTNGTIWYGGNTVIARHYQNATYGPYTAPTTPGIYNLTFLVMIQGNGGPAWITAYQTIEVAGAIETTDTDACLINGERGEGSVEVGETVTLTASPRTIYKETESAGNIVLNWSNPANSNNKGPVQYASDKNYSTSFSSSGTKLVNLSITSGPTSDRQTTSSTCSIEVTPPPPAGLSVMCSANPSTVEPGETSYLTATVYNATSSAPVTWYRNGTLVGSGPTLTVSQTTEGNYSYEARATSNGTTVTDNCAVTVAIEDGGGEPLPPIVPSTISKFQINPSIVQTGEMCKVQLEASNVSSCSLYRNGLPTAAYTLTPTGGTINVTNFDITPGTYVTSCTNATGGPDVIAGPRRCISDVNIRETN